jgi:hypothetical protein
MAPSRRPSTESPSRQDSNALLPKPRKAELPETVHLPREGVTKILAIVDRMGGGFVPSTPPEVLAQLLDSAFFGSLEVEESRPVPVALAYAERGDSHAKNVAELAANRAER